MTENQSVINMETIINNRNKSLFISKVLKVNNLRANKQCKQ